MFASAAGNTSLRSPAASSWNMKTPQVNLTKTEHVFHNSLARRGSLDQRGGSLESSCSALILLCFPTHWPGMWCYFITEAEATSSVSSLRAPATHLDRGTVCNHNWTAEADELSCPRKVPNRAGRNFGVRRDRTGAHISGRHWEKARTGKKTETSATLKTCHPQWTQTTMNSASSLSFSESYCAVDGCSVLPLEFSQIRLFPNIGWAHQCWYCMDCRDMNVKTLYTLEGQFHFSLQPYNFSFVFIVFCDADWRLKVPRPILYRCAAVMVLLWD